MPPRDTDPLIEIIRQGGEDRREQTAVLRELVAETRAHNSGAQERHAALMAALTRGEAAQAEDRGWWRNLATAVGRELWPMFRMPIGGLITAICAYWAWRIADLSPTPTPVVVAPSAPSPAEGLALEIAVPTP